MTVEIDRQEEALIERIARGDRHAFRRLYHVYHDRLRSYVAGLVHDPALAEALTEDVLFDVWQSADGFGRQSKLSTWIASLAHRKAFEAMRTRKESSRPGGTAGGGRIPEDPDGRKARMKRDLRELPVEEREVVLLAFYEGMSCEEIADVTSSSPREVRARMTSARRAVTRAKELPDGR